MNGDTLFFFGDHLGALPIYKKLEQELLKQIPEATIKVQKTQITFGNPRGFVFVSFTPCRRAKERPATWLTLSFGLGERMEAPRIDAAVEPYPGRWTHHVMVGSPDEVDDELLGWIRAAAEFSRAKGK